MLKTLLGHWKANRKKPSLLPEEGDIHFEEPTTINPLFEDSDSSISSANANAAENPTTNPENELSKNLEQNPQVDRLIDLAIPTSSYERESEEIAKERLKTSEHEKSIETPESNRVEENKALSTQDDHLNQQPSTSKASDDSSESSSETESKGVSSDIQENMRIYQPPTSAITNNPQSNASAFVPDRKIPERLTTAGSKTQSGDKEINNEVDRTKRSGILKNGDNQFNPQTDKSKLPNSLGTSKESINPENLRARAIDELIKKFQNRSSENGESSKNLSLDKQNPSSTSNGNTTNGVTKVEQNSSLSPRKSLLKSDSSDKNNLERESLSNIFKIPPPPPLENLKQESRLHGRTLGQNSKTTSPEVILSNQVKNVENKSDGTELGTTRSDSSLERTRVASSEKTKTSAKQVEAITKDVEADIVPETTVKQSFLHSSKHKNIWPKKISELEQNNASNILIDETKARSVNATVVKQHQLNKEIATTIFADIENQNQAARSSTDNKSKLDSSKANLSRDAINRSDPVIFKEEMPNKNEPQSTNLKGILTEKKDPEIGSVKNNSSIEINSQPTSSRDIFLDEDEPFTSEPKINDNENVSSGNVDKTPKISTSRKSKLKSSLSKASSKSNGHKETENTKSYSEDSGITRGDQVSSEATQDATPSNDPEEGNKPTNQRNSKKEKKLKSVSKSSCKKCRRNHIDSTSIKRSQYDDYYDILTGATRSSRIRHSDSCTSELSWEERELLKKLHALRSHRGTVRSTRSRLSKRKYIDESHFRQFRKHRPSSEESSLFAPSVCSCDECWAQYVREYSYSRSSLRGMSPIYGQCTCRHPRSNILGRRVKFLSDTIPEVPLPEKAMRPTTPASKSDTSQPGNVSVDDKKSQKSSETKDSDSMSQNPDGTKRKKQKFSEEEYRAVTPWELEQWNYLVRKQLLRKRRNRARCMGLIALALVIFVGIIVTFLMVFLRRRTI